MASGVHIVKLGGSLLDLPDLAARFEAWRRAELEPQGLLVVGGGAAADVVRAFDRAFAIGEEKAHWLAIRAMSFNAHCTAAALPRCRIVEAPDACAAAWEVGEMPIVDPLPWLMHEDGAGVTIPHRWTFTSDSISAHIATRMGATRLTLLKSTLPQSECGPACAAGLGIVDADFPEASASLPSVELVNLRSTRPGAAERCALR